MKTRGSGISIEHCGAGLQRLELYSSGYSQNPQWWIATGSSKIRGEQVKQKEKYDAKQKNLEEPSGGLLCMTFFDGMRLTLMD